MTSSHALHKTAPEDYAHSAGVARFSIAAIPSRTTGQSSRRSPAIVEAFSKNFLTLSESPRYSAIPPAILYHTSARVLLPLESKEVAWLTASSSEVVIFFGSRKRSLDRD